MGNSSSQTVLSPEQQRAVSVVNRLLLAARRRHVLEIFAKVYRKDGKLVCTRTSSFQKITKHHASQFQKESRRIIKLQQLKKIPTAFFLVEPSTLLTQRAFERAVSSRCKHMRQERLVTKGLSNPSNIIGETQEDISAGWDADDLGGWTCLVSFEGLNTESSNDWKRQSGTWSRSSTCSAQSKHHHERGRRSNQREAEDWTGWV